MTKLEGRGGKGIYKRRNSRSYRVIIHYNTYLKILKNNKKILDHYKGGYVVRVKPDQYFEKNGEIKNNFHKTLELGKNAFLYFKNINDWNKYKSYCSDFEEVAELYTTSKTVNNNEQWIGKFCKFITNTTPQEISLICSSGTKTNEQIEEFKKLKMIREAQIAYQGINGGYTSDWKKLINFIDSGKIYIIQRREETIFSPTLEFESSVP